MEKERKDISSDLVTMPIGKLLLKLAVPTIVAQIVNLLYNVVDRIYIGHMPDIGDAALTGIGLCFPIISLISAFTALISQGGAPRAAISMGQGDNDNAEKILGNCFSTMIVLAVILTLFFEFQGENLLRLFGSSDDTIIYSLPYAKIYVAGSVFVMMSLGLNMFIITQGFTRFSMITVIIGAFCNIILDPIFIYGFGMGVRGAALASVISQAISAVWVISFLLGKKTKLRIKKKHLMPDIKILLSILGLGLSPFVMQATEALVNISFNSSLQKYGGDIAVGSMTVASTVMQMVWMPSSGIGQGAQPIISYNYGAKNAERVKETFWILLKICCIYISAFWVMIQLFPQLFIRIFNDSPELLGTATWTLRLYTASLALMAIQTAIQQTLTAIGKAKESLFIASLRKLILIIPLIFILPNFFENKVFAVFLAEPISDFISVTTAVIIFSIVFRKEIKKLKNDI